MKAIVSATGGELSSPVDPRFGRAQYFVLVDIDSGEKLAVIDNTGNAAAPSGAGIGAAQLVSDHGVEVVITGSVGPNAFQVLTAAKIRVLSGSGTVGEVVKACRDGKLSEIAAAGPAMHGGGRGMGRGMGGNAGGGGGGRRGGGR